MSRVTPDVMPNATDYKIRDEYSPKYRFMRIPLNNLTGSSVQITPTATQLLEFKLPIGVYNLARSYVLYDENVPAGGTANACWSWEDVIELAQNIYFGTGGGLGLCDLAYANNWTKIIRPHKTKFTKFLTHDPQSSLYPTCQQGGTQGGLFDDNVFPVVYTIQNGNIYSLPGGTSINGLSSYIEPQHLFGGSALNTGIYRPRQVKLGDYLDTIFSVDKDLYFPQEMYVRFQTSPGTKMAFQSTSINDPTAGPTVPGNITLSNLYLYLAVEQNQIIANSVIDKVRNGGMKIQIPYTTSFRNPSATTGLALQIQLTRQYGKRLKRMIWALFNGANAETLNTAYDNTNWNASKITSYQTYIDSRPLQDFQLSCVQPVVNADSAINADDWRENSRFLEGSVIFNYGQYQMNWHHSDYFYEPKDHNAIPEDNIDEGLDMDSVHLWQVQAVLPNANAMVSYNYATFVRDLHIHPNGSPSME